MFILPSKGSLAGLAENVCHGMKSCQQDPLLGLTTAYVDDRVEQVRSPLTSLKGFGDKFVMICKMCSAVDA